MPAWLALLVVGLVLVVLGFAGLGAILLWGGIAIVLAGLVMTVVSLRRGQKDHDTHDHQRDGSPDADLGDRETWQRRAARLGWVSVGLGALSLVLLGLAIWDLAAQRSDLSADEPQRAIDAMTAWLPVNVDVHLGLPRPGVVLGLGLALAAFVVGMSALQCAAAMRVLSQGRGLDAPVSADIAKLSRRALGSAGVRSLDLEQRPGWPLTAIPAGAETVGLVLRCTVLIPAHDEEAIIAVALTSLSHQTRAPDRVVVVADNCTDGTVRIARERGVEVIETVGNTQHKAGALNQVLAVLLPRVGVEDVVMVMDADSSIAPDFLEVAVGALEDDPDLVAVGGLFSGEDGMGILGQLQRNEFHRYQRVVRRREGNLFVLTGTASMFRAYALRAVAEARGSLVPGTPGDVYDVHAMTEDNELTLALKSLGAGMTSPQQCRVTTEVMPTWTALRRQRLRWQRGALENVGAYGFTHTTAQYWAQQLALGYGVIALNAYLLLLVISLLAADSLRWSLFWVLIGVVFVVERVVTAWAGGWRGRLLALPLVIEVGYSLFLQAAFVTSLVQIALHREAGWNEVRREVVAAAALPALAAAALVARWTPLPSSVLQSPFVEALGLFVGINTIVFATLSVFQLLPPIRRTVHRMQHRRAARRTVAATA
ncbi:glycosyltransferase [Cellulomonas sp. McL0617]|uniref:glycosyltransferase n=1 Tax=Cellulomonas sp. McL0617 TaxID=3415675 RepID=UPI003CF71D0F